MPTPTVTITYKLLDATKEYPLKSSCPYCGGKLRMSINGCDQGDDGQWIATDLDINCDTEPDIDGKKWEGWWRDHSYDYCEQWHQLHERVVRNLRRHCRVFYPPGSITELGKPNA